MRNRLSTVGMTRTGYLDIVFSGEKFDQRICRSAQPHSMFQSVRAQPPSRLQPVRQFPNINPKLSEATKSTVTGL